YRQVVRIPDSMDLVEAAAIPVNYLTAWIMMVALGNVQAGDVVLVHSAGGGVGQAALQIARWREAKVIGLASPGKHERLLAEGVWQCLTPNEPDLVAKVLSLTSGRGV